MLQFFLVIFVRKMYASNGLENNITARSGIGMVIVRL